MEIKDLIESIVINPTESLDNEYNRVISVFQGNDFNTYIPEYLNTQIIAKDFSKVFNVYFKEENIKYSFFVITVPWTDERISQIINSFSQPNNQSLIYFLSAYPLPDILSFVQMNNPESFFELDAMRNLRNLSELENNHYLLSNFSTILNNLSKKYFEIEINYEIPQNLKNLEKVIINYFRKCDDYEFIEESLIDYFPKYSMILFGLFLSELLIKNFNGELFYSNDLDIKKLGVGFSRDNDELIDLMAHPIDKIFNFFFYGKESSVINWYYELKYYFNNKFKG